MDNDGYTHDPAGGTRLQFKSSSDNGRTWTLRGTLSEAGRDLDNAQLVQRADGTIVLAYRSVRWGESYRILVRTSADGGATWGSATTVDANEGAPGSLSNPDRGVYEPNMNVFPNGDIGIMYANEKYALATPAYSQVISMKVSTTGGTSWGAETFPVKDLNNSASRPGMPVWTRMTNGSWVLVYELCGTDGCNGWVKTPADGRTWSSALGQRLPAETGAPYVLSLSDGRLVVTSNTHEMLISRDFGQNWYLDDRNPWGPLSTDDNLWPAIIQTASNEIAVVTSAGRAPAFNNGHNIQIKFGTFSPLNQPAPIDGATYTFTAQHSGLNLDVDQGSGLDGAKVQQYTPNNLPPQNWVLHKQADGAYLLQNQQSGKVLDVDANSMVDGAKVQQYSITGCACQHWFLDYVGGGNYQVRAAHSGKNLDVTAGSTAPGAAVEQWSNNFARPQRWKLTQK